MSERVMKLPAVKNRTGSSRSSIYEAISRGDFPKPIKLGPRAVGWIESEIDQWVSERMAARSGEVEP